MSITLEGYLKQLMVIVGKWPYNNYIRLKQGCLGQHNVWVNLEHPQMNIICIAAAGS